MKEEMIPMIFIVALVALFVIAINVILLPLYQQTKMSLPTQSLSDTEYMKIGVNNSQNIDNLKNDCYTQGFIDGRGSVFEEQSTTGYHHERLGVPYGYISNRSNEWRVYADKIAGVGLK